MPEKPSNSGFRISSNPTSCHNAIAMFSTSRLLITLLLQLHLTGCAVLAVADAAVTAAATAAKVTVKAAGAVVDAVIPDSKEKNTEPEK